MSMSGIPFPEQFRRTPEQLAESLAQCPDPELPGLTPAELVQIRLSMEGQIHRLDKREAALNARSAKLDRERADLIAVREILDRERETLEAEKAGLTLLTRQLHEQERSLARRLEMVAQIEADLAARLPRLSVWARLKGAVMDSPWAAVVAPMGRAQKILRALLGLAVLTLLLFIVAALLGATAAIVAGVAGLVWGGDRLCRMVERKPEGDRVPARWEEQG